MRSISNRQAVDIKARVAESQIGTGILRVRRTIRRYGAIDATGRALRFIWRHAFEVGSIAFRFERGAPAVIPSHSVQFEQYETWRSVPMKIKESPIAWEGHKFGRMVDNRLRSGDATSWIALHGGAAFGYRWAQKAAAIGKLWTPIRDEDTVVCGGITHPDFRGREIAPAMLHHIATRHARDDADVCTFSKPWSNSGLRSIDKAEFRSVAAVDG